MTTWQMKLVTIKMYLAYFKNPKQKSCLEEIFNFVTEKPISLVIYDDLCIRHG